MEDPVGTAALAAPARRFNRLRPAPQEAGNCARRASAPSLRYNGVLRRHRTILPDPIGLATRIVARRSSDAHFPPEIRSMNASDTPPDAPVTPADAAPAAPIPAPAPAAAAASGSAKAPPLDISADEEEPAAPATGEAFAALGLDADLVAAVAALGYEEPTPIQRAAIAVLLTGRDVLGQAATGTGKTAAFALPLLQRAVKGQPAPGRPQALVLVPTRELAMQVAEAVHKYGRGRRATVLPVYGGEAIGRQIRALSRGVAVVVATPGRALDHLERGTLTLDDVRCVVLDEADEMLDLGFAEDLDAILGRLPATRQTALFSATLPSRILAIAERHLRDPAKIAIAAERTAEGVDARVRETAYVVARAYKHAALGRVLDMEAPTASIVFCRTRLEVEELSEAMNARGFRAEPLHGGLSQEHRDRVMRRFREGASDLLVATDVAARGLDIQHLSHVFNFDVPSEPEAYVHRIGRTGRAGREGVAITFVEPREHRQLRNIQFQTRRKIEVVALPTAADLRRRRMELTAASLREALVAGELDHYRSVVEGLAADYDVMDVAAAAVKLAHEAGRETQASPDDERDLPVAFLPGDPNRGAPQQRRFERGPRNYGEGGRSFDGGGRGFDGGRRGFERRGPPDERFAPTADRFEGPPERRGPPPERFAPPREAPRREAPPREAPPRDEERRPAPPRDFAPRESAPPARDFAPRESAPPARDFPPREAAPFEGPTRGRPPRFDGVRIFVGAGRLGMIRPGDLVGAITHETGLPGSVVGTIEIADRFSLVEVKADVADRVLAALRGTKLRGRKVPVRFEGEGD
jgi:ATP-dependent RNA helicase DeaD